MWRPCQIMNAWFEMKHQAEEVCALTENMDDDITQCRVTVSSLGDGELPMDGPEPRSSRSVSRAPDQLEPPAASSTFCLPAEIHGIMARSSLPVFSMG